ncbi:MAG: Arm DNA-binding domain-containing protein [Pseudomonas sp.]|uniref:Arm DNA-binding domain-containing protein n=1 Tax=Pseudomonas sp. TaxID=306 RepID=UPI003390C9F8
MKRSEIKRRPLSDTALAGLEPDASEYRELDGNGLYFRVKADGQKSWQLRYKKPDGKWSWLGLASIGRAQSSPLLTCPLNRVLLMHSNAGLNS